MAKNTWQGLWVPGSCLEDKRRLVTTLSATRQSSPGLLLSIASGHSSAGNCNTPRRQNGSESRTISVECCIAGWHMGVKVNEGCHVSARPACPNSPLMSYATISECGTTYNRVYIRRRLQYTAYSQSLLARLMRGSRSVVAKTFSCSKNIHQCFR